VRENRPLRLTRRGLETWNGRDMVALADERASNSEHKHRPTPARQPSTLPRRAWGCDSPGLLDRVASRNALRLSGIMLDAKELNPLAGYPIFPVGEAPHPPEGWSISSQGPVPSTPPV
jgi:hypothetical protein